MDNTVELTTLTNNGLELDCVKQFNSDDRGFIQYPNPNKEFLEIKIGFNDCLITKYDDTFKDCGHCKKSKSDMEVQVLIGEYSDHFCFDCFELIMKGDCLSSLDFDFNLEEIHDEKHRYEFVYNGSRIFFDHFYYEDGDNRITIYFYAKDFDLSDEKPVGEVYLKLSDIQLNFLKSQYDLKRIKQLRG
jgi:hypothetical protein